MGFGGISPFQLIIILLIILLLFGGKRLRNLGADLGSAIKGFKKSMDDSNNTDAPQITQDQTKASTTSTDHVENDKKS